MQFGEFGISLRKRLYMRMSIRHKYKYILCVLYACTIHNYTLTHIARAMPQSNNKIK